MKNAIKIICICTAALIFLGTLVLFRSFTYQYINSKMVVIEIGCALIVSLVLFLYKSSVFEKAWRQPLVWGMGAFCTALVITSLTSFDYIISWFGNVDRGTGAFFLILLMLCSVAVGSIFTKEQARKYLLMPITASAVVLALSIFWERKGWAFLASAQHGGFLGNTSITGTYLVMAFFTTLYLFLSTSSIQWKWAYGVSIVCILCNPILVNFSIFTAPVYTFSSIVGDARGAALSIVFGIIATVCIFLVTSVSPLKRKIGKIALIIFAVGVLGGLTSLCLRNTAVHRWFATQETNTRFIYWNIGLKGFYAHPILGTGPETYGYTYQTYFNPEMMLKKNLQEVWSNKPHNAYVQVLSETGIVGAVGYICLWIGLVVAGMQEYRRSRDRKFLACMGGLFVAYLLNNFIFFDTLTSHLLFFMIVGYIISLYPHTISLEEEYPMKKRLRILLGSALLAATLVIVIPQIIKVQRVIDELSMSQSDLVDAYARTENVSSYGSGLFLAQTADYTYQNLYKRYFSVIKNDTPENKKTAIRAIDALVTEIQRSFKKYPTNEQGELTIGRLEEVKMALVGIADPDSLLIMRTAAEGAIAVSPTNPQAYLLLGQEYNHEKRYDDAYAIFEKAREIDPAVPDAHYALINLANFLGDTKKARFFIERAKQESDEYVPQ